jgi:hypothetical protein
MLQIGFLQMEVVDPVFRFLGAPLCHQGQPPSSHRSGCIHRGRNQNTA